MIQNAQNPQKKTIRDARGRWLTLQTLLGRGSFGKVYRAEDEATGEAFAAKVPLSAEDFSGDPPPPEVLELYGRLVRDEAAWLKKMPETLAPESFGLVDGGGATPCLLQTCLEDSLLARLHGGVSFAELCGMLASVCEALAPLHEAGRAHGNLKPGNIFFEPGPDGHDRVRLTDPLTPEYLKQLGTLNARMPGLSGWLPPELLSDPSANVPVWADTFALGKLLFEAVVQPTNPAAWATRGGPFIGGIDKAAANRFRGALSQRLLEGNSNPHVRDLLIRRATALLNRALSTETAPSPPYRFHTAAELAARLVELQELFHPGFAQIGQPLLEPGKSTPTFDEGEEIRFSLSFRCHGGIEDVDLITCMTYVRDLEADQKVRDAGIEVAPAHDGHRFRFNFRIPKLYPGRFLIRVALAVKGSPGKPTPRDLTIEVLAKDGVRPLPPVAKDDERPALREPKIPAAPPAPPLGAGKAGGDEPISIPRAQDERRPGERVAVRGLSDERSPEGRAQEGRGDRGRLTPIDNGHAGSGTRDRFFAPAAPGGGREEGARGDDFVGFRDTPRPGRDLVWVAEEERAGAGSTTRELEPLSSRPTVDPWDMDDKPAKIRVEPRDLDEAPVKARGGQPAADRGRGEGRELDDRGRGEGRDLDDRPAKLRVEPREPEESTKPRAGRARPSDETAEMTPDQLAKSSARARIEPAPVGRDAVRHATGELDAPAEPRREAPRRHLTPVVGPAADRGRPASSSPQARGVDKSSQETVERPPRLADRPVVREVERSSRTDERPSRPDGRSSRGEERSSRQDERASRDERYPRQEERSSRDERASRGDERSARQDERASRSERPSTGKPGEQFKPELYYKEAREKPMPGEEDDEFFRRGALRLRREDFIIIGLGVVLLVLIAAIVWVII